MLRIEAIEAAAEDFVSAALLGDGWEAALSRLSLAAGGRGATLLRSQDFKFAGAFVSPEVQWAVGDYVAGRIPPNSRAYRANHTHASGFRVDHDDYSAGELARDPYYQEFLRPNGFFWHAAAGLIGPPGGEIAISIKRPLSAGHFERADAAMLNHALPKLRAAVRIAGRAMSAEASGVVRLMERRGAPVFELDSFGRVLRTHVFGDDAAGALQVRAGRLVAAERLDQPALDRAVARAVAADGVSTLAALSDPQGGRSVLQIVPLGGRARDIFLAAAAVAALIRQHAPPPRLALDHSAIRDALALTDREVEVALLLAEGASLAGIARDLRIQLSTVRVHLKSVFEKTGATRQAELVALLWRLRP